MCVLLSTSRLVCKQLRCWDLFMLVVLGLLQRCSWTRLTGRGRLWFSGMRHLLRLTQVRLEMDLGGVLVSVFFKRGKIHNLPGNVISIGVLASRVLTPEPGPQQRDEGAWQSIGGEGGERGLRLESPLPPRRGSDGGRR